MLIQSVFLSNSNPVKQKVLELIQQSLQSMVKAGQLQSSQIPSEIPVEHARRAGQGDYATTVAMALARVLKQNPRMIAAAINQHLPANDVVERTEIAGPGFLNFYISQQQLLQVIPDILEQGQYFGINKSNASTSYLVEFVSANPTGPLHIGHGRGAALGDALTKLLRAAGYSVNSEYYVNDLGRQMDILTLSVWIRYMQLAGLDIELPPGAYQGQYIVASAARLKRLHQDELMRELKLTVDDKLGVDANLDRAILKVQQALGTKAFLLVRQFALDEMVQIIRDDLHEFDVSHDRWFFESEVQKNDALKQTVELLRSNGYLYESEGALWFSSSRFGDEKDRVVVRSNGEFTYFASDIAYHLDKYKRGYNCLINVWGADHHGYIARMKAALEAVGEDSARLQVVLVQFASLFRGDERVQMSTRAGEFVTLKELVDETGKDAARFFYVLRKSEQHLEFDLELAKSKNKENPVYYVQYAHARICSVLRQVSERNIHRSAESNHQLLQNQSEMDLIKNLNRYPEVLQRAAQNLEPHQIAYYLRDVANDFHVFYNKMRILDSAPDFRDARLDLIQAVNQVLANGLTILGVNAPESM